jgi:Protein of unknown function (DUF1592)/Protein of unknown function (DUF1588)/Protein of unknown function (DUF1585)/Protein of unknown function (DUF1587)/Protein of unknown function (DUF1595)
MATSPDAGIRFLSRAALIRPAWQKRLVSFSVFGCAAFLASCTPEISPPPIGSGTGGGLGTGTGGGVGTGTGGGVGTGTGGGVGTGTGGGVGTGTGGGVGTGTGGGVGAGGAGTVSACNGTVSPGLAPLRRLTRFEYNNTVRDFLGDTTLAGNALPPEDLGTGFGNEAAQQSASILLIEKYESIAEALAAAATATPAALGKLAPCGSTMTATSTVAAEDACARTIVAAVVPRSYRRAITTVETDEFVALYKTVRTNRTFASGIAGVLEAALQSGDFLFRVELGVPDPTKPTLRRPSGAEMATRLSYFFWGTMPDPALTAASSTLLTAAGVMTQAKRLLDDQKSHPVVAFFFDNLLPINSLALLERDKVQFPKFTASIGALMRQETQRVIEYEMYEAPAPGGTWPGILTAPYTFVNAELAAYYGMTGVTGTALQKTPLDTTKRMGILTLGGITAGTTVTNFTNPVRRGGFILAKMMCRIIPLPTDPAVTILVVVPDPTLAKTGRQRYSQHSMNSVCAVCHQFLDPMGFTMENFDAVGQWRDQENGVMIDASGTVPGTTGTVNGPVQMVQKIAGTEEAQTCFASHWLEFGMGRALSPADACTRETLNTAFKASGYNVKQMLLALTQTDAFQYMPPK